MPKFRVSQGSREFDVEAFTEMEARAKVVTSPRSDAVEPLTVRPVEGGRPPASPPGPIAAGPGGAPAEAAQSFARRRAEVPASGPVRLPSMTGLAVSTVLLTALLLASVAGATWWIVERVTHVGSLGNCARIGLCVDTPLATVEDRTGVDLPSGSEVVRSTASRDGDWASALVRLPEGATAPSLDDASSVEVTPRASTALLSAGADHDQVGSQAGAVGVFSGEAGGRTVVFLRYDAAGVIAH